MCFPPFVVIREAVFDWHDRCIVKVAKSTMRFISNWSRRDATPFLLHKLDISQFQNGVSLAIIAVHACSLV